MHDEDAESTVQFKNMTERGCVYKFISPIQEQLGS